MHPLAHMLTGALIGQLAPNPAAAALGGMLSHGVLDFVPHTEGETFGIRTTSLIRLDLIEAGVETIVGAVVLWQNRAGGHARRGEHPAIGAVPARRPGVVES